QADDGIRDFHVTGVQTCALPIWIYAANTFGLSFSQVLMFGVALNVAAGLGAFLFGFVDDRLGGKRTVMFSLMALSGATLLAVWAPNATWLWVSGILIGIFVGPNQSASRSLMARMVPEEKQGEFFGFFAFSGKATSFLAPLAYGEASRAFGSLRAGVATVLVFFVVGMVLLCWVREAQARLCELHRRRAGGAARQRSRYLALSLSRFLAISLCRSLALSLSRFLALSLSRSLALSLSRFLALSLSRFLA